MTTLGGKLVAVVGSATIEEALTADGAQLGPLDGSPIDLVVHVVPPATEEATLLDTDEEAWDAAAEAPARAFLATLQAAHPGLAATGGHLIVVLPVTVNIGAAGLVAATTGWGAVRLLAKSAAQRWTGQGISVTTVIHRRPAVGDEEVDVVRSLTTGPGVREVVLR